VIVVGVDYGHNSWTADAASAALRPRAGVRFTKSRSGLSHSLFTVALDVYGDYIPEEDGGALNTLPEPPAPTVERPAKVVPLRSAIKCGAEVVGRDRRLGRLRPDVLASGLPAFRRQGYVLVLASPPQEHWSCTGSFRRSSSA
jgi:hypothetical protein